MTEETPDHDNARHHEKMAKKKEEKKKEMEEEDPSSEIEKDPAESKASISVLDTVKIKSDAALATSDGNESVKQVASQIASYFGLESSGTEQ